MDAPPERTPGTASARYHLRMPVVLVIEDEAASRRSIAAVLRLEGYTVELAGDGDEALRRLRAGGIDLALLDVQLPRRDGLAVLDALGTPRPAVLPMTGAVDDTVRAALLVRGLPPPLTKPFTPDELIRRMLELVPR